MEQLHTVGTISCKEISFSNIAFEATQYHVGNELIHNPLILYSNLQTAVGNRGNTISQFLKHLKPRSKYDFSVQVQMPSPSGSSYCSVYVYAGRNATVGAIASAQLFNFGEWTEVTGNYVARRDREILNIVAACDSEDSSVTGNVLIDDISLTSAQCGWASD